MAVNRQAPLLAIPLLIVVATLGGPGSGFLRRLATDCVNNVYSTPENAVNIPVIPPTSADSIPAYIALCQEWIRMDADYPARGHQSHRIVEDEDICMDWSSPHFSLLEIFAALIVSNHVPETKYRHNCDRTKVYQEAALGFDYTTIQQVLNTPGLRTNNEVLSTEAIKQQCRRCMLAFDPQLEAVRVKSKGYHHCLAWPEDTKGVLKLDPASIPFVPYKFPGVTPFSSMIVAFRQRLYHSALEWQDVTDKPPKEANSGVVYWLDPTTLGLTYHDVLAEIPNLGNITSLSILSGPLCATAILPTGETCHEYGEGLRDYLAERLPSLASNGYNGEHGVTYKIVASTAAAFSRMILSHLLICPPHSSSCLLPSAAKRIGFNSALVLDDPNWMKSVEFMGHHGTVTIKVLDASRIPPIYTPDPSDRRLNVSPKFSRVNAVTDDEGYPDSVTRTTIPSDEVIDALTPQHILDDMDIAIGSFARNPNLFRNRLEVVPTKAQVQLALNTRDKLEANQVLAWHYPDSGLGGKGFRHGELATDADFIDSEAPQPRKGLVYWNGLSDKRHDSLLRIQHEWETAFYNHLSTDRDASDPSTIFEIQCPDAVDGSTVTYGGGAVVTKSPSTIIVSDYNGVTIKDASSGVTIATGIENAPVGTVYRDQGTNGYKITQVRDASSPEVSTPEERRVETSQQPGEEPRKVIQIGSQTLDLDLPFKAEVQKVCNKYAKRLQRAVAAQQVRTVSTGS